jgi:membrane protein DedA with SNARE-associated domain
MELTRTEFFLYLLIGQIIFGALIGFIPLVLGRKRAQTRLGNFGFLASILAAIIAVAVFCWLIVRKRGEAEIKTTPHDSPAENS